MATAPADTFEDFPPTPAPLVTDPSLAGLVSGTTSSVTQGVTGTVSGLTSGEVTDDGSAPLAPVTLGDTLADVNADDTRRNKLIDDNNLLNGVVMTSSGPQVSSRPLIVRPTGPLNAIVDNTAMIATTVVEAEYTDSLMQSNYNAVSVQVSAPYVTASADYSDETTYTNTQTQKTILMSSRYLFPQGRIDFTTPSTGLTNTFTLSPDFLNAIDSALNQTTKTLQREALYTVFQEYGHIFRTKVQIGGTLSAHTKEVFSRSESETDVKQDVKAGLEVAVKDWGAGVNAGHGNTSTTITTKEGRTLDVKYIVQGGDYTQIQNTDNWIASTSNSVYWRVIEVTQATAVVDLLPTDTQTAVKNLMIPLLGQWVSVAQVPNTDSFPVKIYAPVQSQIPAGWFYLGHSSDATQGLIVKPTLPAKQGRNTAVIPGQVGSGATAQPFPTQTGYSFMSSYFGGYDPTVAPGSTLGALRPGLYLEGKWTLFGSSTSTMCYVTHPYTADAPEDTCLDLSSVVRVNPPGSGNPPKSKWVVRQEAVLFNSGET